MRRPRLSRAIHSPIVPLENDRSDGTAFAAFASMHSTWLPVPRAERICLRSCLEGTEAIERFGWRILPLADSDPIPNLAILEGRLLPLNSEADLSHFDLGRTQLCLAFQVVRKHVAEPIIEAKALWPHQEVISLPEFWTPTEVDLLSCSLPGGM